MMEVKQNTAVDLNELLAPVKTTTGSDEVDDVDMTDLTEAPDLNCDVLKSNEKSNNGLITNGDDTLSPLIDLDSTNTAVATPVTSELEDALLAEDDVLPKLDDVKVHSVTSSVVVDDILADKVETSNSTTSSNNVRDPGDDLDTLLSKINDIVEDCLDNEVPESSVASVLNQEDSTKTEKEHEDEIVRLDDNLAEQSSIAIDATDREEKQIGEIGVDSAMEDIENSVNEQVSSSDSPLLDKISDEEDLGSEDKDKRIEESTTEDITGDGITQDGITDDLPGEYIESNDDKAKTEEDVCGDKVVTQEEIKEDEILKEDASQDEIPKEDTSKDDSLKDESLCIVNDITENPNTEKSSTTASGADKKESVTAMNLPLDENCKEPKIEEMNQVKGAPKAVIENNDQLNEEELLLEEDKIDDMEILEDDKLDEDVLMDDIGTPTDAKSDKQIEDQEEKLLEEENVGGDEKSKADAQEDKQEPTINERELQDSEVEANSDGGDQTIEVEKQNTAQNSEEKSSINEDITEKNDSDEKVANEDSDDDIVFFVDKAPESESAKSPKPATQSTTMSTEEKPEESVKESKENKTTDDDDIVILDDDEELQAEKKTIPSSNQNEATESSKAESPNNDKPLQKDANVEESTKKIERKHSTIDVDNSDNARDEFVVNDKPSTTEVPKKVEETDDNNSNCSSSSNLLLEAKQSEITGDEPTQEENENDNEEDEDDADVELIETESKEAEMASDKGDESSDVVQPAKRPRLSEDSEMSSKTDETGKSRRASETLEKKSDEKDDQKSEIGTPSSLKRSHDDVIELELDDKSNDSNMESANKKAKTESPKDESKEELHKVKSKEEEQDSKTDAKKDIVKIIPSEVPIPLYPPPNIKNLGNHESIALGFLKKFRKSFDKMTKNDLEELVLQKVVEAIIHRSEFAEMRELIEKQEKIISSHRTKISELSKQFRDLEMVHNRVVKDIEQRNSQFIMPVKITRAVGLQVYIPHKKSVLESTSTQSGTPSTMPTVSPQRPINSPQTNLTSPQRPYHSIQSSDVRSAPSSAVNTSAMTSSVQRRGCAQKVTPIRPVPNASSSSAPNSASSNNTASSQVYRNNTNQNQQQISSQPRILNKNATTATGGAASSNISPLQRQRFMQNNSDSAQRLQHQQNVRPVGNAISNPRLATQQKLPTPTTAVAQRRPEATTPTGTGNNASLDNYMNTLSQLTGGNTAVSITPAKPKEKAVIDLTDEDEIPPAPQQNNNAPVNPGQRRILPSPNNNINANQQQYGRTAPPLTRIPSSSQLANNNKTRQMATQGQKSGSFSSTINTPAGTSITRIVGANAQQRVKYSHPAPLPATPPQAFNPSWKLPPPRPTIRISNLDNGIVISWTMEESMDRHAECVSYQIYAYQETSGPPLVDSWRHVGDVKAMLLPMAVTLTQFQEGQRYFFAVRAVDCHQRYGPFSLPKTWS